MGVSQSAIISQILSTLQPRIDAVFSQALSSQSNRQVTQVSQVSSNRDALIRQQQLLAAKREQERKAGPDPAAAVSQPVSWNKPVKQQQLEPGLHLWHRPRGHPLRGRAAEGAVQP